MLKRFVRAAGKRSLLFRLLRTKDEPTVFCSAFSDRELVERQRDSKTASGKRIKKAERWKERTPGCLCMAANEATDAPGDKGRWKVVREKSHRGISSRRTARQMRRGAAARRFRRCVNKHPFRATRGCTRSNGVRAEDIRRMHSALYAIARSNHPNEVADFRNLLSNGPRFTDSLRTANVNRTGGENGIARRKKV